MAILRTATIVTAIAFISAAQAARASDPQSLGRCLGIGWSDGYHAPAACPPKHVVACKPMKKQAIVAAQPIPWWKIPASEAESGAVVHELSHPSPATGPSLFRQPGE